MSSRGLINRQNKAGLYPSTSEYGIRPTASSPKAPARRINTAERRFRSLNVNKEVEAIRKAADDLETAQANLMAKMATVNSVIDGGDDKVKKKFKKDGKPKPFKCKKSKKGKKSPKKPRRKTPTVAKMMRSKPKAKKPKQKRKSKCR